jgi:large subunit ribosomal protein L35
MPKQKTHKGLKKRFKVTGTGKVNRKRAGASHLMKSKNAKRRRRISTATTVVGRQAQTTKIMLGK